MVPQQLSLFGQHEPAIDPSMTRLRRLVLDQEAWVDQVPGWVVGQDALFQVLEATTGWHSQRRKMYDRVVDVPRLVARVPEDGRGHPVLGAMREALSRRYGVAFGEPTLALYRGGSDSVAWHRDRVLRDMESAFVAVVSLGGLRRFQLRPHGGGRSRSLTVGSGDVVVMGGACQRTWEHCVPKLRHAEPRMAIMFRHPSRYEAPELDPLRE